VAKLRVLSFAISIDGFGAGPNQDLQNPLGVRGPELMEWFFSNSGVHGRTTAGRARAVRSRRITRL
jgi:hypothetical protein